MQAVARILGAVAVIALLAGSAWAQKGPAKYGEEDKPKTPAEVAAERDAERLAQARKERRIVDPAGLVMLETVVDDKTPRKVGGRAAGMLRPVRHHGIEVDIEHDTAEVEQQNVGGGGRWRQIHGNRLQNWTGLSNGP